MRNLLLLFAFICWGANAQDLITFSAEFGAPESKGFEIRKEFNGFYVGLYAENLKQDEVKFNWGLNAGLSHDLRRFTLFYGANVGLIKNTAYTSEKTQNLALGLHTELDYNFNDSFFIGVKLKLDSFHGSEKTEILTRPMLKIGYKF